MHAYRTKCAIYVSACLVLIGRLLRTASLRRVLAVFFFSFLRLIISDRASKPLSSRKRRRIVTRTKLVFFRRHTKTRKKASTPNLQWTEEVTIRTRLLALLTLGGVLVNLIIRQSFVLAIWHQSLFQYGKLVAPCLSLPQSSNKAKKYIRGPNQKKHRDSQARDRDGGAKVKRASQKEDRWGLEFKFPERSEWLMTWKSYHSIALYLLTWFGTSLCILRV